MILRTLGGLAMMAGQRVVVVGALPATGLDLLRERFLVDAGAGDRSRAGFMCTCQALWRSWPIRASPSMASSSTAGGSLKIVANFAVGYDNIDLEAVRERGVRATNTPDVLTNATAELAIALMLAAARRIAEADALTRSGQWLAEDQLLG
jgi:glyoxylate reductase